MTGVLNMTISCFAEFSLTSEAEADMNSDVVAVSAYSKVTAVLPLGAQQPWSIIVDPVKQVCSNLDMHTVLMMI